MEIFTMKKMQKLTILVLALFIIGMSIGAVDATHTVKKGNYKVTLTNAEYKKLTTYETKYKTVQKTKTVNKTQEVIKTRQVNKTKTEEQNDVTTAYIYNDNFYNSDTKQCDNQVTAKKPVNTAYVKTLEDDGYTIAGTYVKNYSQPITSPWTYTNNNGNEYSFSGYVASEYSNFTKTINYTEDEEYTVEETYTVKENYTVKVPYKVRKDVTIKKKIPNKYVWDKKANPIVKKVKVTKTIGGYKYVGLSYAFGLQTASMKKTTQSKMKALKKAGWKINSKKHKAVITDDGYIKHYYYFTKKVTVKEPKIVGYKYQKVKRPLFMTIKSWDKKELPNGKVHVLVSWNGKFVKANGYGTIA